MAEGVRGYRDLVVWRKAMDLAVACYEVSATFPKSETYGLTSQLRRAVSSVPANIAEGQARNHTGEFVQFLGVAAGSLAETETHVLLATRLGYMESAESERILEVTAEVHKMLHGLRRSLSTRPAARPPGR